MGRLIIHNRSSVSDGEALRLVAAVVDGGRVSNYGKQYCYLVTGKVAGQAVAVASELNKASDRFTVYDDKHIHRKIEEKK